MNELKLTGGAKIGNASATFPFATLKVNQKRLELKVSVLGNLIFQPSDITSIEPYTMIPLLGQGIKIKHTVSTYKEQVIFWTFKDPKSVVDQIKRTGFLNQNIGSNQSTEQLQKERQLTTGSPIKKPFVIAAIVLWNLLFLIDIIPFIQGNMEGIPLGKGSMAALGILFIAALLSLFSPGFRGLILKEGRDLTM